MREGLTGELGKVETALVEGAPHLRLSGECDVYTSTTLREQVETLLGRGHCRLVFDLERVTFLDSSILTIFLAAHRHVVSHGGEVVLLCRGGFVRRLLTLLEMDRLLKVRTPEEWRMETAAVN